MKLYTEVMIESAEQAEALPEGSVAMHEDHWPFQKYQGVWQSEDRAYSNADLIGWTTYALIEAEEVWGTETYLYPDADVTVTGAARDKDNAVWQRDNNPHTATGRIMRQYRTPWEEA